MLWLQSPVLKRYTVWTMFLEHICLWAAHARSDRELAQRKPSALPVAECAIPAPERGDIWLSLKFPHCAQFYGFSPHHPFPYIRICVHPPINMYNPTHAHARSQNGSRTKTLVLHEGVSSQGHSLRRPWACLLSGSSLIITPQVWDER